MGLHVGDAVPSALADTEVLGPDGTASRLGERWTTTPAAVVFLRHFACIACSEHVALLAPRLHELARLGLRVVYVGNGEPRFIDAFVQRNGIEPGVVEVVTDPSLHAFEATGLHRLVLSTFGPRALLNLGRATLRGFHQRRVEGDTFQQGGVLVVDRQGKIAYLHRDERTGDHAPVGDVVDAALRVAGQGSALP